MGTSRPGSVECTNASVRRFERFQAPYCSFMHDFIVTRRHVLFPILPLSGSKARLSAGGSSFAWEPAVGGHVGLILREQGVASLRWFQVESCYVYHVLNAWDDGGRIVADVMQYRPAVTVPGRRRQRADRPSCGASGALDA